MFAELLAAAAAGALAYAAGLRGQYGRARVPLDETSLDTLREPLVAPNTRFALAPDARRPAGGEVV